LGRRDGGRPATHNPATAAQPAQRARHACEQTPRRAGGARYAPESGDLAAAAAAALRQEGAAAAALLSALPPPAAALEALAGRDGGANAAAAEALAVEWFALLPALAARASGPAVAAALLQVRGLRRGRERPRAERNQHCRLWRRDTLLMWSHCIRVRCVLARGRALGTVPATARCRSA